MSVSNIMQNGLSALTANQSALRTTSNNIANVNTQGYVREDTQMTAVTLGGVGAGVQAISERAADQFLTATHLRSISSASQYDVTAGLLDRAQASLGDPTSSTSLFANIDTVISKAASLINDPSSSLRQGEMVSAMQAAFEDLQTGFLTIDSLRDEADTRLRSAMEEANLLMEGIAGLNSEIQKAQISGSGASGLQTEQSRMMDQLAELIDFKTTQKDNGGVELRTTSGLLLVDQQSARLSISKTEDGARYNGISITSSGSDTQIDISRQIQGGEIRGLLNARDHDLPELSYAMGELSASLAGALNDASNAGTAFPPPTSLTGRNTGLLATDALNFTGSAVFAVADQSGRTINAVTVDFDAGTMTNSSGSVSAIGGTIGSFTNALNSSFGASANVSFTNGVMSFSATGTNGVAIAQDPAAPSDRAGKGVSAFFGMNDVIRSNSPSFYETGLTPSDAHGITSGEITFGVRDQSGNLVESISYTPVGTTMADVVSELNSPGVLGYYAKASINSDGRLTLTPLSAAGTSAIDVLGDDTQRGATGASMSSLFGLGIEGPAERARGLAVSNDLLLNPSKLPTGAFDTGGTAVGSIALAPGNNTGALALEGALSKSAVLHDMSGVSRSSMSITDMAAEVASSAGSKAAFLEGRSDAANALKDEAALRRSSAEGVNLDEEMVRMTVYQQSYSAASRLITAARDMYDTLLGMV